MPSMQVKDLMTKEVVTVVPDATIEQVADILHERHFTGVPVVDEQRRLLGVIMERDFITAQSSLYLPTYVKLLKDLDFVQSDKKRLSPEVQKIMNAKAADVMNSSVVSVGEEDTIETLAEVFATKRVNPVPVVDKNGFLVGVISRSDLIQLFSTRPRASRPEALPRVVDVAAGKAMTDLGHDFALVSKIRASVWFLISAAFLVVGFLLGVAWVIEA